MNKYLLLIIGLIYSSTIYSQSNDEELFYVQTLKPEKKAFYEYVKRKDFDSLLFVAKVSYAKKTQATEDAILTALITANLELDQRDSAMKYVDQYLDISYRDMDMFGGISLYFLCDYRFSKKLCFDAAIEHYVLSHIEQHYRAKKNPQTEAGVELIKLGFLDQKLRGLLHYTLDTCTTQASISIAEKEMLKKDNKKLDDLLALLKKNKGYLSKEEVGEVATCQNLIFTHASDTKQRRKEILPLIKLAFEQGKYSKAGYIFQIARTEEMEGKIKSEDGSYRKRLEELSKQYQCETVNEYFMDF